MVIMIEKEIEMAKTLAATEAKQRFSAVLADVERGETVTIERHGRPVARIVPIASALAGPRRAAADALRALRKETGRIDAATVLDLRDEGRRG